MHDRFSAPVNPRSIGRLRAVFPLHPNPMQAAVDLSDVLLKATLPDLRRVLATTIAFIEARARKDHEAPFRQEDFIALPDLERWCYEEPSNMLWMLDHYEACTTAFGSECDIDDREMAEEHMAEARQMGRWWTESGHRRVTMSDRDWDRVLTTFPINVPSYHHAAGDPVYSYRHWIAVGPQRHMNSWWMSGSVPDWWVETLLAATYRPKTDAHGVEIIFRYAEQQLSLDGMKAVHATLRCIPAYRKAIVHWVRREAHQNGLEGIEGRPHYRVMDDIQNRWMDLWDALLRTPAPAVLLKQYVHAIDGWMVAMSEMGVVAEGKNDLRWHLRETNWGQ